MQNPAEQLDVTKTATVASVLIPKMYWLPHQMMSKQRDVSAAMSERLAAAHNALITIAVFDWAAGSNVKKYSTSTADLVLFDY